MRYPRLRKVKRKRRRLKRPAEVQRLCRRPDSGHIARYLQGSLAQGSEFEPDPELHLAWVVSLCRRTDDAELSIAGIPSCVWWGESGMVEGIENVGPELHFHGFFGRELFIDTGIEVVNSIGAQTGKVAGSIARHLVARIGEAVDVEIRRLREGSAAIADSRGASA